MRYKILLCIIAICTLVSACSGSSGRNTLTVAMGLTEDEWTVMRTAVFPLFEQAHHLRINAYQLEPADLITKLRATVGSGRAAIDVFSQDNMQLFALVEDHLVEPLDQLSQNHDPAVYDNLYRIGTFAAHTYFVPYRPNVQITYYNKEKFDHFGIALPETWDDLLSVARMLFEKTGQGRIGMKFWGGAPTATQLYELIVSAGGDPFSFNDEGCIKTFRFLSTLAPYLSPDSKRAKWDTTNTYLANESFYYAQNWPFGMSVLIRDYGKTTISAYEGVAGPARRAHVIGGEVFGIPRGCKHRERAVAFIHFMQSQPVQQILADRLGWPSIRRDVRSAGEPWRQPFLEAVSKALADGVYRENVLYWGEFEKYINEALVRIVFNGEDSTAVLNDYHAQMSNVITAYEKKNS